MRLLKSHPLFSLINGYLVDSPQPSNISYLWNFGSLLGFCLVIQIVTGVTLAMHVRCGNTTVSWKVYLFNRSFIAVRSSGLGERESLGLNLASLLKARFSGKPISILIVARSIPYDKTYTSRILISTVPKPRESLVGNRWIISLISFSAWLIIKGRNTGCSTRTIKVMSGISKGEQRTLKVNTGLPKGSNTYWQQSNRSTCFNCKKLEYVLGNSKGKERVAASLLFKRSYVTGSDTTEKVNVGSRLNKLAIRSKFNPNERIDRNLYKLVSDIDMLIYAYENIKSKPGNMTQGVSPETLDGISKDKLIKLSQDLKSEKFTFSPSRRIHIPKPSGGTRPLSIASPMDKVVQEAMRLILEAIFEPLFKDVSHGFRPNKSCHTALKKVSQVFQPVQWVIEGDLAKFFDTIPHHKLMEIISGKIEDKQFIKLLWKALSAGYFEFRTYKSNIIGTPQGSIISPLLANIFLHQLDTYVLSLKSKFDRGIRAPRSKMSRFYEYHILKARKDGDFSRTQKLIADRSNTPSIDFGSDDFKRLVYVRYADDWVIGIRGSIEEARLILAKVKAFCTSIELTLSETKTKLTSLNQDSFLFLGTKIYRSTHVRYSRIGSVRRIKRNKLGLILEAPLDIVKKKLSQASFMKDGKSTPKFLWLHMDHDQIILLYNSTLRGFLNYYNFTHNYGRLASYLEFILKQSCAKLLATKFRLGTMAQTYKKFGGRLSGPKGHSLLKPSYKISLKYLTNPTPLVGSLYQEKSTATLDNLKCSICSSTHRVEMHHIRAMKDLNPKVSYLDRQMIRVNRKRIALCRVCHMMKHNPNRETTFHQ